MANRFELLQVTTISGSAQAAGKAVAGAKELLVFVELSAPVTTPAITVYLQSSDDGGSTWYDIAHRGSKKTDSGATEPVGGQPDGERNIMDAETTAEKYVARYTEFGDKVRLAYIYSGAGSIDLRAEAVAKP